MFFISPGYYSRSKRNWKQCLCKVLEANKVHYGRCASGILQSVWIFKFFHPCLLLYLFSGAIYCTPSFHVWWRFLLIDTRLSSFQFFSLAIIWIALQSGLSVSCCTWHVLCRVILLVREDKQIWHFIRKCCCVKKKWIKARESFYFSRLELFLDKDNLNFCVE